MSQRRGARVTSVLAVVGLLLAVGPASFASASASARATDAVRQRQWYLSKLDISNAWSISRGAGVKVGILDSGVDGKHVEDLRGAVVGGRNFATIGSPDGQTPLNAHGTEVASVLAGRGHGAGNESGVIGVAPSAGVLTAALPQGQQADYPIVAAAIRWLVDQGIRVLNISLAFLDKTTVTKSAIAYAEAHDVVVVAAAGNDATVHSIDLPAGYPGVVAVSGIDASLAIDSHSSTGAGVALAAPYSTGPTNADGSARSGQGLVVAEPAGNPSGAYGNVAGTSFGTPVVAGVAALVRSKFPQLDAANVINRLLKSATPHGSVPNDQYGYGIVNAYRALTADIAPVSANPLGSLNPTAPNTSGSPSASAASPSSGSPSPAGPSAPAASATATAAATSSGLGAGAWGGIAAVAVAAAIVIGLLVGRDRRRRRIGPGPGPYTR